MAGQVRQKLLENVSMERHGYDDSNPEISISEINFKHDESELIQGLGEFFYNEYRKELPDRHGRKTAFEKARSLIEQNFDRKNILQKFNYQEGLERALKQAISHGYIWKIEVEKPWHPKFFFNFDKMKTFPSQHKEVVLWTAQHLHKFFTGPGKVDILRSKYTFQEFNNSHSILEQNSIEIGNRHTNNDEGTGAEAVYFSQYLHNLDCPVRDKSASRYAVQKFVDGLYEGSPVLEFRIPSELIYTHEVPGARYSDEAVYKSLRKVKSRVGSPLNFLEGAKRFEFQYRNEKLFLDLCTGIWDYENNPKSPDFENLTKFHKRIFVRFPFRTPWNTDLTNQKLSKEEAKDIRESKLKQAGYYQTIEYSEDILQRSEEICEIASSFVEELEIPYVSYQGSYFPVICSICGTIFQNSFCSNCGHELEEDLQNPFIIEKSLQNKEKELSTYRNFFSEPLKWEDKVREVWSNKEQKHNSQKFWIRKSTTSFIEEIENFESKLIDYSSGLVKLASKCDGNHKLQKRARRIKEDIQKTKTEINLVDSIK